MKKTIVLGVIFLLVLSGFISVTIGNELSSNTDGLVDSPWPMKCHDTRHTGRSPYSTADNNGEELWRFKTDNWIESGIVIDDKGTIYFGSFDRYLYALNNDGSLKWKYEVNGWIWSTPAIAEDGTIYVGTYGDYLYALNSNGSLKWRFYSNASISSSPAIASDGTIYFGTMGNPHPSERGCRVYAVNPDGTEKWFYQTDYKIVSDPAIGNDGTIYIGSGDSYLYALNPDGTLLWRFKTGDYVKSHPSIADDGTIYFDSFDGNLYALNPDGTEKWHVGAGGSSSASASIDADGILYDPGDQYLRAFYPNGTLKWSFNLGTSDTHVGHSSPAIGSDGTIFIGTSIGETSGGDIIAINPNGTERWRSRIANRWVESSPCIGKDGTVYIASCSHDGGDEYGYLHAFGSVELKAISNGPYKGMANESIQFFGEASGGESPYIWFWDFGDGNTSTMQNPTHIYKTDGEYEANLTVTDNTSMSVSDGAFVKIYPYDVTPPTIELLRPLNGYIYIWNRITFRIFLATLIFGEIDVKAPADDDITGVSRVEFYLDGKFVHAISSTPYHWLWDEPGSGKHVLKVTAFDQVENNASVELDVWKFF